jgi:hypothetical protein
MKTSWVVRALGCVLIAFAVGCGGGSPDQAIGQGPAAGAGGSDSGTIAAVDAGTAVPLEASAFADAPTKATLVGQIVLETGDGLSDMSRVQISAGTLGTLNPSPDGTFALKDFPPGATKLDITYTGGLGGATESAYQRVSVDIAANAGEFVRLGRIVLPLGIGTVAGSIAFADTTSASGRTTVTLANNRLTRTADASSGSFELTEVPVGVYALTVERAGYALSASQSCAATVTVPSHGAKVSASAIHLDPATVTLQPATASAVTTSGST